jgi:hypothetical protein
MGRVRAVSDGKRKKNRAVTRVGSKQYKKRRFAHLRATAVAGHDNALTRAVMMGGASNSSLARRKTALAAQEAAAAAAAVGEVNTKKVGVRATVLQHYTRVGLTMDPSATAEEKAALRANLNVDVRREKLPKPAPETKGIGRTVSEAEGTMLCNLVLKHGTNFKRMSLDYKLNPFQLTAAQLQRKVANYIKWERAAFPDAYRELSGQGLIAGDDTGALLDPRRRQRPESVGDDDDE